MIAVDKGRLSSVRDTLSGRSLRKVVLVLPGKHTLVLDASHSSSDLMTVTTTRVDLCSIDFVAQATKVYQIESKMTMHPRTGSTSTGTFTAWLKDVSTGQVVAGCRPWRGETDGPIRILEWPAE